MENLILRGSVENKQEGNFRVVASTGSTDRLGDSINPEGWYLKNYKKNPVMLWAHDNFTPPVARAEKVWVEGGKLMIEGKWASSQFAQELRVLEENGFLNTVSVGFMPLVEDEEKGMIEIGKKKYRRADKKEVKSIYEGDGIKFEKQELLEVSWVCVPALPEALVEARKDNLELVAKSLEMAIEKEEKPYPEEHSCRLEDPDKYEKFRRKNCAAKVEDKCIDHIYGIIEDKSELQAMRYKTDEWTEEEAEKHCKENEGMFEPAEKSKKEKYSCECLDCGYKFKTEKHCRDTKCPKCGGETRRVERPGPGKGQTEDNLKAGRVLSEKNRALIKDCIKQMGVAISSLKELVDATEPEKGASPQVKKGRKLSKTKKKSRENAELYWLRIIDKATESLLKKQREKND